MKRIALATGAKLPTLNEDDLLLVPPLRELGVTAVPAVWDSPDVCWEEFQGVVVRSCWDYHHRLEEFLGWVVRLERAGISLGGQPSQAVLKRQGGGDYGGQGELGGSAVTRAPPPPRVGEAEGVRAGVRGGPVYARVDGVERAGPLVLRKLELIEPHLFLGW